MLQELRVHHASPEGVLFHLGEGLGFGRMTVATAGGDQLAERLVKGIAGQESAHVVVSKKRDSKGYIEVGVSFSELSTSAMTLPTPLSTTLMTLFRKAVLCAVGSVQGVKVTKATQSGLLVALPGGVAGVVIDGEENETALSVRILDYDAKTGFAVASQRCADRAPQDVAGLSSLVSMVCVGDEVECRVVYHCSQTETGAPTLVVVEVSPKGSSHTILGYLVQPPPSQAATGGSKKSATLPKVGTVLHAYVRYTPCRWLYGVTPFLVLTPEEDSSAIPSIRLMGRKTRPGPGLPQPLSDKYVAFPWRPVAGEGGASDSHAAGDGDAEDEGKVKKRRMEEMIDAYERDQDRLPASPDEFTKLLLANPNSSYLWTRYMAFHTGLQQYEKARAVADRALNCIAQTNSKEQLNVWVAYLNLENMHGTTESLDAVFKRALQRTDNTLVIYEKLADIFAATDKHQQLINLCRTMSSKFRHLKSVWEKLGRALIDAGKRDALRRMLKDMSTALNTADQCFVAEHLAIHEYKHGAAEQGRAMFEGLVTKAPKRSDIWSAYIAQEIALIVRADPHASVSGARSLFERLSTIALPPRVMQQHLTKFLEFEQRHGSADDVEKVKQKARAYVESRISATTPNETV